MTATRQNLSISVAAGKGGTGKTLISASLAQALAVEYPAVQVLDCDVEEPNCSILLHPEITGREDVNILVPEVDISKCIHCSKCAHVCEVGAIAAIGKAVLTFHDMCSGCGACAFVCPTGAISEAPLKIGDLTHGASTVPGGQSEIDFYEGRLDVGHQRATPVSSATKAMISPEMITIVDAPPGTACPMQEAVADTDYCILVTEPTPFGLANLREAVDTCRRMEVPCGVVVNRDRDDDVEMAAYISDEDLDVLMRVPERRSIAEAYARGETLLSADDEWRGALLEMYENIAELVVAGSAAPSA